MARRGTGLGKPGFSVWNVLFVAWQIFQGVMGQLALLVAVEATLDTALHVALERSSQDLSYAIELIYENTVTVMLLGATLGLMQGVVVGERVSLRNGVLLGVRRWGALLLAQLVTAIQIVAFGLLLLVPGIVRSLSLAVVEPIVMFEACAHPLRRSTQLTKGRRWPLLAVVLVTAVVAGVPRYLLGAGLGAAGTALALPLDTSIPGAWLDAWVGYMGRGFGTAALYAAYLGLVALEKKRAASTPPEELSPAPIPRVTPSAG